MPIIFCVRGHPTRTTSSTTCSGDPGARVQGTTWRNNVGIGLDDRLHHPEYSQKRRVRRGVEVESACTVVWICRCRQFARPSAPRCDGRPLTRLGNGANVTLAHLVIVFQSGVAHHVPLYNGLQWQGEIGARSGRTGRRRRILLHTLLGRPGEISACRMWEQRREKGTRARPRTRRGRRTRSTEHPRTFVVRTGDPEGTEGSSSTSDILGPMAPRPWRHDLR